MYRTGADVPAGNFTASVERTESTSASVSWTAPSSPNGVLQRYVLTSFDESAGRSVTQYEGLSLGYRVSGLTPYTRYVFTVSACTTAGCLNTSVTAVTLEAPPTGQLPPHVSASSANTLNVTWQPPTHPNGNLTHTVMGLSLSIVGDKCAKDIFFGGGEILASLPNFSTQKSI